MIRLKPHLQAISDLNGCIAEIKDIADKLPNSTLKGELLTRASILEDAADDYTDSTIKVYENILNFAMVAAT